jgi:tripeptidyl-peptidase-2
MQMQLTVPSRQDARGIYLRDGADVDRPSQFSVSVKPLFRRDDLGENPKKLAYEQRLTLISTTTWARCPEFLFLNSGGSSIPAI